MYIIINLKIFIFLIIFLITRQIKIYGLLMLFAFIHEIGHLLSGLFLGLKVHNIKIAPFGFSIAFLPTEKNRKTSIKKLIIALAGPITNLIVICIVYIFCSIIKKSNLAFSTDIIYANLLLFLFNMLPIYPLDGGRVIKEILNINFGEKNSYKYIKNISYTTVIILTMISSIAVLIYKNIAIPIIISYLWIIVIKENCNTLKRLE